MANTKKGMSKGKMMAGAAGLAAVGAGAYYLLGPNAKAHQKKASKLAAKVKKEVVADYAKAKKAAIPLYKNAESTLKSASKTKKFAENPGADGYTKALM